MSGSLGLGGFDDAFDRAAIGMAVCDLEGRYLRVNRALCSFVARGEDELIGASYELGLHPEDAQAREGALGRLREGSLARYEAEQRYLRPDGELRWGHVTCSPVCTASGRPAFLFTQVADVTSRRKAEQSLRDSDATLGVLLESTPDTILVVDAAGGIVSVNAAAQGVCGYAPGELVGKPVETLLPQRLARVHQAHRAGFLSDPRTRSMGRGLSLTARRKDGSEFPVEVGLGSSRREGALLFTCVVTDITERRRAEEKIAHQATHDALTGLPNRAMFLDRVSTALARARRGGTRPAVLFLDLDRFKVVNDSLGHGVGDEALTIVAERLRALVREVDTVARFGGDEFAMLCEDLHELGEVEAIAERILAALAVPLVVRGRELVVTASVGIAFPDRVDITKLNVDGESLLRDADAAMYQAKDVGRARAAVFDEAMRARALQRLETEHALRHAVERRQLRLHYQPLLDLRDGRITGVEALLRWEHPERGMVPPGEFIELAEETGLIGSIGAWVLREACRQAAAWRAGGVVPEDFAVSVNVSPHQLVDTSLVHQVSDVLHETGLPAGRLHLELTEGALMRDPETSARILRALRGLGVHVSIDDFGTGYSSLSYLRRFPVDVIKVDRAFVHGLAEEGDDYAIVSAIIGMAHALGLRALAEGVEDARQLEILRRLDCDAAQGFYFGRPAPSLPGSLQLAGPLS